MVINVVTCKQVSTLPARMKKTQSKIKALECLQDVPHYESMRYFPNAQGQLTPKYVVESCRISNSSEILWLSSKPARMKKIRSQMKALECQQDYIYIFSDAKWQLTLNK